MMQFEYPLITGYTWNAIQNISLKLGIPMDDIFLSDNGEVTYIGFVNDITEAQKAILDTLMASNPCAPDLSVGVTYRVADLWAMRQWFAEQIGITPTYWFEQEKPDGSGECYIYLNFPRRLTVTEKKKILDTYQMTIGELMTGGNR